MFKVKVIVSFSDKYNKKLHKAGDILEVTKERLEEINGTKYGEIVEIPEEIKEEVKEEVKEDKKKNK